MKNLKMTADVSVFATFLALISSYVHVHVSLVGDGVLDIPVALVETI